MCLSLLVLHRAKGGNLVVLRAPECGADYLTMTWRTQIRDTPLENSRQVIDWAERRPLNDGGKDFTKAWAWQGYTGLQCGQVSIGERVDGSIVRLVGKAAHDWLAAGLPIGHNVSRFDIALTFWSDLNRSALLALHSLEALGKRNTLRSRPFEVRLIDGFGDGDTLYVGDRTSSLFVRCYDKEKAPNATAEHKGAIRYEVECKERLASEAVTRLASRGYTARSCLEVLTGLLGRRGICALGTGGVSGVVISPAEPPVSSLEVSLLWLRSQVRPTVARLMREGYELEVLEALGLGRYYNQAFEHS